ncbi:MAG: TIGR00366 family protein [Myxococcota bacterium]
MVYQLYSPTDEEIKVADEIKTEEKIEEEESSLSQRLENSYLLNLVIFILILIYNVVEIVEGRFNLSLNKVNMIFLGLGFLLHPSPKAFVRAAQNGASLIIGVVIQFPLYAGIYGMIKGTALLSVISDFFIKILQKGFQGL